MDEQKRREYEEKHEKTALKLRRLGKILLPIGIALEVIVVIGTICFDFYGIFFLGFIGMPIIFVGFVCLIFGYQKKVSEYTTSQHAPVAKDFANYMMDGTSDTLAKNEGKVFDEFNKSKVRNGVSFEVESKTNGKINEGINGNTCAQCGYVNPTSATFCAKCGAKIIKYCPYCGGKNDDGARYCNSCGKEII